MPLRTLTLLLSVFVASWLVSACATSGEKTGEDGTPPTYRMSTWVMTNVLGSNLVQPPRLETLPDGTVVHAYDIVTEGESTRWYGLDMEKFKRYADFRERLRTLPAGAIVHWQKSDVRSFTLKGIPEPAEGEPDAAELERFCRELGLRLVVRTGG